MALLAVIVVVGGALLMRGDDGDGSGDPAQAVLTYLDAANAGDCGRLVQVLTGSSLAMMGASDPTEARGICQGIVDGGDELVGAGITVQSSRVTANDGTDATVELVATADGATETTSIPVRNEGGAWKVDLSAMSGSGGSAPPGDSGAGVPSASG